MDIPEVKMFNSELSGLYDNKPPISKAKMSAITKGAVKAIKFYKHVVHSVEKFILKCKPEYKIPGLYVIDSIVRQSRHQFGAEKDVFAPRFAKNMQQTFINLLRCPPEDKRNIIRVLNLWQKNYVFCPEVIQPLFDLANPNHPTHQEFLAQQTQVHSNGSVNADAKNSPALASQHTPTEPSHQDQGKSEAALLAQLRHMQHLLRDGSSAPAQDKGAVNFNRRLLNMDFEYESEDDGGQMTHMSGGDSPAQNSTPALQPSQPSQPSQQSMGHNFFHNSLQSVNPNDALGSILANPEILRHLQSLQAQMMVQANFPQMQGINNITLQQDMSYVDMSQPPPSIHKPEESNKPPSPLMDEMNNESDIEFVDDAGPQVIEIDGNDSRSPSPKSSRRRRSRERSRRSRSRSRRGSRSRSRDRRGRRASREREREKPRDREREREREKERERDREKERERKKKGLPFIRKDTVSVCSTTLWVGHLSKLVQAEELSDSFGAIGDVVSIDLVPPRGCAFIVMNRRRDAARAINKLNKQKMHGKAITVAWAPGKGVKGREWKDYWEAEAGACYVPWARLPEGPAAAAALEALEEGGMLDEETLPIWLQRKPLEEAKPKLQPELSAIPPAVLAATANPTGMMVVSPLQPPPSLGVEPGCLPPALGPLSFAAHPALPLPLPLLGFKPTPQAAGLQQALHLQAVLAHHQQQQHMAAQLLLAPPPRLGPPIMQPPLSLVDIRQDDPMEIDNTEDMPPQIESHSKAGTPLSREDIQMTEKYKNMISLPPPSFNVPPPSMLGQPPPNTTSIPPPGNPMPPHNSSIPPPNTKIPPPLTSQPPPALGPLLDQNIQDKDRDKRERESGRRDRDRRERDRDGGRRDSRHEREKDRERDRNGERNDRPERPERNDRERERGDRDRERDRGERDRGRDRGNRWGGRGEPGSANRDRPDGPPGPPGPPPGPAASRSLQDRLWEMANGPGQRPHRPESPPKHPRNHIKDGPPPDGLLGDVPPPGTMMPLSPPPGPPLLPPMAPFRIGREEMRMGGMGPGMGPRGPMRPGGPGMWMDGPNPPFGPRFPGGPPFNRPPFDGPPFDGPPFDGPPFDGPGPPFDGPGPHFERQRFDREFDRPFDRSFDRPHFDGPGRPPYDRPGFDGPYEDPHFERPMYDGPPDAFFERGGPRGPPGPPRGMRNEGRGDGRGDIRPDGRGDIRPDGRGDIRPDGRRPRGDRDAERSRNSRWAGRESLEPNPNDFEQTENDDMGPSNEREPEIVEKPPVDNKVQESTVQEIVVQNNREESVVDLPPPPVIIETAPTPPIIHEAPPEIQDSEPPQKEENESVAFFEEKENVADSYVSEMTQEAPEIVPVEVAVEPERNVTPVDVPVEREEPPAPVEVSAEADSAEASEEGRSTPCRDEPPPGEAP